MSRLHRRLGWPKATAAAGMIDVWRARVRDRRRLAELNAHLLDDIGVAPACRDAEVGKPFWRP